MNLVVLTGNLCFDPDLKYTANGLAVCNMRLAVSRGRDDTDFIDVVALNTKAGGTLAERCAEWLQKGSKVGITGSWRTETWTTQDGYKRSKDKVLANNVEFISNTRPKEEVDQRKQSYAPRANTGNIQEVDPQEIPF